MLLVLSITFYFHYTIRGCMCSTDPSYYRWLKWCIYSSCYHHHQIGSIHFLYWYHVFRVRVPKIFVTSYSVTIAYTFREERVFVFIIIVQFWLADRTRLFVQYTISLSSLCKLIWRHWTYKMPVRYVLSSVWVRLMIFSLSYIMQYVGLHVSSLPISLVMIWRIHILCLIIIIKSKVWTITHCLG